MEKIHGTSTHITFKAKEKKLIFSKGGVPKHQTFVNLFNEEELLKKFSEIFTDSNVTVYGEAYGGSIVRMSGTYGKELKFIAFEVKVGDSWLDVLNAENVVEKLGLEFVYYTKIPATIEAINAERDKDSTQAIRNGMGSGKIREGVVLRPLVEVTLNNGERIIAKHRRDEFRETATPREVNPELAQAISNANAIADEWVTEQRLEHVLDKLPQGLNVESTKIVIQAMLEDVYREAKGEIIESREAGKAIFARTAKMFREKLKRELQENG